MCVCILYKLREPFIIKVLNPKITLSLETWARQSCSGWCVGSPQSRISWGKQVNHSNTLNKSIFTTRKETVVKVKEISETIWCHQIYEVLSYLSSSAILFQIWTRVFFDGKNQLFQAQVGKTKGAVCCTMSTTAFDQLQVFDTFLLVFVIIIPTTSSSIPKSISRPSLVSCASF